jgi:hypothetical protein
MRADPDAEALRQPHRLVHHHWVRGTESTGDVGDGDIWHHPFVAAHRVEAEPSPMSQLIASGTPAPLPSPSPQTLYRRSWSREVAAMITAPGDIRLNIDVDAQKVHAIFNHPRASMLLDTSSLRYDGPR